MRPFAWTLVCLLLVLSPTAARPETRSGTLELSLSPAFEVIRTEVDSDEDSESFIMLPVRVGVFATPAFEIEGDFNVTSTENTTGLWAFLNAVYNFQLRESDVRPFVLAGLGFGNAARVLGLALDTDDTVLGFDLGAGVKAPLNDRVAFRVEFRYDRVTYDQDFFFGTEDVTLQGIRFLFGFSVFFNTD